MEIIVKKSSKQILSQIKPETWPTWKSPVKEFDWHYDEQETCYFIEGEVVVEFAGKSVEIKAGDIAVFPKGLSVKWKVLKPVVKHYSFDDFGDILR